MATEGSPDKPQSAEVEIQPQEASSSKDNSKKQDDYVRESLVGGWKVYGKEGDKPREWSEEEKAKYFEDMEVRQLKA